MIVQPVVEPMEHYTALVTIYCIPTQLTPITTSLRLHTSPTEQAISIGVSISAYLQITLSFRVFQDVLYNNCLEKLSSVFDNDLCFPWILGVKSYDIANDFLCFDFA